MWPFKSKHDKMKREDVVDAICKLEKESANIDEEIMSCQGKIDELKKKGAKEKSHEMKIFYAKKINNLNAERQQNIQRAMYLMYNIQLLNKLKRAIDDNQFFAKTNKMNLGALLADQKGLAKFLNKALNTRVNSEEVLTQADETFKMVEQAYEKNESIYGINKEDDELLAMFENEEQIEEEESIRTATETETEVTDINNQ